VRELLRPVFARYAWAENGTLLAGTTNEGAALASDRFFGVCSESHCSGEHEI
jgi:hypothetical protein